MEPTGPSRLSDFAFHRRHEALRRPEYLFEIDEYRRGDEQRLIAHLRVHRFSPAIMKAILSDWRVFRECVSAPIYAAPVDETGQRVEQDKWERFVSLLGFQPTIHTVVWEGKPRRLFLHHKDFHGHADDQHQPIGDQQLHPE